jgi:hypothetical protein
MDAATIALLAIVGVIVAAIALHLIAIAASLSRIAGTLGKVKGGVVAIAGQTEPINSVVAGLAGDVSAIDDDLEGLLVIVGEAQAAAAAAPPPPPPRPAPPARRSTPRPARVIDDVEPEYEDADEELAVRRPSMREAVALARSGAQ